MSYLWHRGEKTISLAVAHEWSRMAKYQSGKRMGSSLKRGSQELEDMCGVKDRCGTSGMGFWMTMQFVSA